MRQRSQLRLLLACLLVLCLSSFAHAQLPNLSQISDSNESQAVTTTGGGNNNNQPSNTRGGNNNTPSQTGTQSGNSQQTQSASGTRSQSGSASASGPTVTSASGPTTNLFPTGVVTSSGGSAIAPSAINRLSGAPTLQGVGIPTMVVPFTANAPFMQKSTLPEGTVFIAVGAVLAFLGACVIAWRALVAWSINRSVKRAAMASIMASETKNPGGWASNPFKPAGGFYHQAPGGSTLDLNDKNDRHNNRASRNPAPSSNGSGLFFSPTASTNATTNIPMTGLNPANNRSSTFLPAGYYASPSAQLGSGNSQTTIGGVGSGSPSLGARRTSLNRPMSNMQLAPPSRDGQNRNSTGRPISNVGHGYLNPQASASSLQVGTGHGEDLPGSRAPSAYLEDLFENHGNPAMGPGQGHQGQR